MAISHLSEDEQTLIEVLRELALEKVAPRAAEIDHTAQFPRDMEELATALDAVTGATRAIVDAGWVPYSYQVGQTGKTVKPTLYMRVALAARFSTLRA